MENECWRSPAAHTCHMTSSCDLDSWSVDHNTILMKKEQNERH